MDNIIKNLESSDTADDSAIPSKNLTIIEALRAEDYGRSERPKSFGRNKVVITLSKGIRYTST